MLSTSTSVDENFCGKWFTKIHFGRITSSGPILRFFTRWQTIGNRGSTVDENPLNCMRNIYESHFVILICCIHHTPTVILKILKAIHSRASCVWPIKIKHIIFQFLSILTNSLPSAPKVEVSRFPFLWCGTWSGFFDAASSLRYLRFTCEEFIKKFSCSGGGEEGLWKLVQIIFRRRKELKREKILVSFFSVLRKRKWFWFYVSSTKYFFNLNNFAHWASSAASAMCMIIEIQQQNFNDLSPHRWSVKQS